ncbi:hypothetical protein PILCRDRAFT_813242 [Piloderma croceum F 1598]|uniref:Uncharacterized protein n=1 Tax=Piloderma croceum (strain F 1598) TaxID=765440 RepID=A0A0C3BS14_PILCF|nr:hypothetical protein PILCRDRAFT_813242 [Piloderma croceum F 1598]
MLLYSSGKYHGLPSTKAIDFGYIFGIADSAGTQNHVCSAEASKKRLVINIGSPCA